MKTPKAKAETADQRAARLSEEERIKVMQVRADADEAAAGRRLLTKKTRAVMRLFGSRRALAGVAGGPASGSAANPAAAPGGYSAAPGTSDWPLGYDETFPIDKGRFFKTGRQ